jgi:hypothetical protein
VRESFFSFFYIPPPIIPHPTVSAKSWISLRVSYLKKKITKGQTLSHKEPVICQTFFFLRDREHAPDVAGAEPRLAVDHPLLGEPVEHVAYCGAYRHAGKCLAGVRCSFLRDHLRPAPPAGATGAAGTVDDTGAVDDASGAAGDAAPAAPRGYVLARDRLIVNDALVAARGDPETAVTGGQPSFDVVALLRKRQFPFQIAKKAAARIKAEASACRGGVNTGELVVNLGEKETGRGEETAMCVTENCIPWI